MSILNYVNNAITERTTGAKTISFFVAFLLLAAGCQPNTPNPTATLTQSNTPAPTIVINPTATQSIDQPARQALEAYYTALVDRDYTKAASLFTIIIGINRSDLIRLWEDHDHQGWRLTGYEITNQRQFDETRIVFWVNLTQEGVEPAQYETVNVVHQEAGYRGWFVGDSTLDKIALQGRPRTRNGVTVFAGVFFRYVEGYVIRFNIKNDSPDAVIWGREGEICGELAFEGDILQAACAAPPTQVRPGEEANVGLFFPAAVLERPVEDLPTGLTIALFQRDADGDGQADPAGEPWAYHFDLEYDIP